jgi:hypothetical protein
MASRGRRAEGEERRAEGGERRAKRVRILFEFYGLCSMLYTLCPPL